MAETIFPQAQAFPSFDNHFLDKTLRIDYYHIGDAKDEIATLDQLYVQGIWAGSKKNLIDAFNLGRYYAKVFSQSGELLFSKGFDSYFGEYKTTNQALAGIKRAYHESILIPFPKAKVKFVLERRDRSHQLHPFFEYEIDPEDVGVIKESLPPGVEVLNLEKNGAPHDHVDIALVAEGYTIEEKAKALSDGKRAVKVLFSQEPYKSYRTRFNVYGVFRPSRESGCDEPRRGIYKHTSVQSSFNALGLERYLLTEDNKNLRDIAAHTPYDTLVIMINHDRYGGGGIYNSFCVFTADNIWWEYLLLHEFGHSFSGLADEYYTSTVAYNDFYPQGQEPLEPNITALLDPPVLKWRRWVSPGVPIPTPWGKDRYDAQDQEYQKIRSQLNRKISELKKQGKHAEAQKLEAEADQLSQKNAAAMDAFFTSNEFRNKVGAFEGAGYASQGLYRPMLDCLMFSKGTKPLCRVCEQAVIRIITHYSQ